MAITVVTSPSLVSNVRNPFWYTFSSTNSTLANFKFVIDVFTGSTASTKVFRDRQSPKPSTSRVDFSPNGILRDYVYPEMYYQITASTASTSTLLNYSVQVSEEYGAGASGTTIYGPLTTVTGYCLNSVATYQQLPRWNYRDYIIYTATTTERKFLTNAPTTKKVRSGEYETLSFMTQNFPTSALDVYLRVQNFRLSGGSSVNNFSILNLFYSGTSATTGIRVFHFGVGPANLDPILSFDINFETDYKYIIDIFMDDINGSSGMSETRTFELDAECSRFPTKRFMFQNRFGVRDYFTATLAETNSYKIDRTTFEQVLPVNYQVNNKGTSITDIDVQDSVVVNTNWVNDEESAWLKELFTTLDAFEITADGDAIPIIIKNTNEEVKQRVNDKLYKYEISYDYAFKYNV